MRRFRTGNIKLHVGIFLPVSKQQGKLDQEPVVRIAKRRKRLRARVAVEAALERLAALDQVLPVFKVVRVRLLSSVSRRIALEDLHQQRTYNEGIVFSDGCVLLIGAAVCAKVAHDCRSKVVVSMATQSRIECAVMMVVVGVSTRFWRRSFEENDDQSGWSRPPPVGYLRPG